MKCFAGKTLNVTNFKLNVQYSKVKQEELYMR